MRALGRIAAGLALAAAITAAAGIQAAWAGDMLAAWGIDGGFETASLAAPDNPWSTFVKGSGSVVRDTEEKADGSYSARLHAGSGLAELDLRLSRPLPPGEYALRFKAKVEAAMGMVLAADPGNGDGHALSFFPNERGGGAWRSGVNWIWDMTAPGGWREYVVRFTAPEGGAKLVLGFATDGGNAWIDDVTCEPLQADG